MDATSTWAAISAAGSVASAAVAAWAARQSSNSAREANAAATALTAIEHDRRHDELRPEFAVTCTMQDPDADSAMLYVALKPGRLERLDEVTITVLDETGSDHWARSPLPPGVTRERAEAFVWGPWEFETGASDQVISNRTTVTRSYSLVTGKNWDLLAVRHTRPGRWMEGVSQGDWRKRHKGKPTRLLFTCRREGYEPWVLLYEVATDVEKRARIRVIT